MLRSVSAVSFNVEEGGYSDVLVVPDDDVAVVEGHAGLGDAWAKADANATTLSSRRR